MRRYTLTQLVEVTAKIPDKMPDLFPCEADRWFEFLPGTSADHKRFAWLNLYLHTAVTRIGYTSVGHTMDAATIVKNGVGLCAQVAHVFVTVARVLGYKSRRLGLYEIAEIDHPTLTHSTHSVAEVFFDDQWRLFDPTAGVYWRIEIPSSLASVYWRIETSSSAPLSYQRMQFMAPRIQVVHPAHLYAPSTTFPLGQLVSPQVYAAAKMQVDD